MKSGPDPAASSSYEQNLSRRVLDGEPDAMDAAGALFESKQPTTLPEAAGLVGAYGELTPEAFQNVTRAFDRYRHLRDMPCS